MSQSASREAAKLYRAAVKAIGGLSNPSKMPCYSWSIPAKYCGTGMKLAKKVGSVCSFCYATKGFYMWPAAQAAMDRRWKILLRALGLVSNTHNMLCSMRRTLFVDNFIYALNYLRFRKVGKQHAHFRWFDSGDLLSEDHLAIICDIARATPEVQHWLPTKEYRIVGNTHIKIPSNLTIRVSAAMIGGSAPNLGYPVSVVNGIGLACPAPSQDGKCMDCRACWDSEIPVINYTLH